MKQKEGINYNIYRSKWEWDKKKFIEINGSIPKNVTIQTWFSMLLQHGVKPYQDYLTDKKLMEYFVKWTIWQSRKFPERGRSW